jgi:hypothetical protein
VEQAKYLRQNLTEEACLQILRQNDVKAGKPPRESIGHKRPNDPRQRLANQAGRSGPPLPSDGISKLTKDMMQNPQIREINRALVGVMGAVQVMSLAENIYLESSRPATNMLYIRPRKT